MAMIWAQFEKCYMNMAKLNQIKSNQSNQMKSQTKVQHQPNDVMKINNSFVHKSNINRYEIDCKM